MDGIFDISTFTEPRFRRLDLLKPKLGMIFGLTHFGTAAGVFAMLDYCSLRSLERELLVYIPADTDFKGWGGKWWSLESVCRAFPDSEIARHFSGVIDHPENYTWIYPNLEPFVSEDWFQELLDATPDLKFELGGDI